MNPTKNAYRLAHTPSEHMRLVEVLHGINVDFESPGDF